MVRTLLSLAAAALVLGAQPALASSGDVLRTLNPSVCPAGNYAATISGKQLLVSCPVSGTPTIYAIKAKNGKLAGTHPVAGVPAGFDIAGMAYDTVGGRIVVCAANFNTDTYELGSVNASSYAFAPIGSTTNCAGGLELDQSRRLWGTPFAGSAVNQLDPTNGTIVRSIPLSTGALGGCMTSGVAVEAGQVFVGTVGFDVSGQIDCGIYKASILSGQAGNFVPAPVGAIADLVCDNKTFADTNTTVIWTADAASSALIAREAPGSGGAKPPKCK